MSEPTYAPEDEADKPLVWLHGAVRSPPFSSSARREAGFLLRRLQRGEALAMPHSRPLPRVGSRCHELRIQDADRSWRIVYRTDEDAVVIVAVHPKSTRATPHALIDVCRRRLRSYDSAGGS
jgi:phage-related protein